jgi:hypothetical protein
MGGAIEWSGHIRKERYTQWL